MHGRAGLGHAYHQRGGGKGSLAEQCKTGAGFLCSFFLCVRLVLRGGTALMGSKIVCNR